ncbi:MAG: hypothetical protein QOJ79_1974 [Actinomycetota bacterium]|jgi:hypothetical protein|nr:hypothetical protein [Actinomycetota bacterium]
MQPLTLLAIDSAPAGGAELTQIIEATVVFGVVLGGVAWYVRRQRAGKERGFTAMAQRMADAVRFPIWASLPLQALRLALLVALFGMYWDISIHIDKGRDPGPLANPAHWFILFGLAGVWSCGAIAMALARDPLAGGTIKLTRYWRIPIGSALLLGCGTFSLMGFPLDDVWHRLFGQDVTLFGPTHLMLIGGASLSTLGGWLMLMEGIQVTGTRSTWVKLGEYAVAGGFLVGLSTFQAEFDFGVPQFRFVLEPVMVMAAASIALVTARVRLGKGGALFAWLSFLVIRGTITLLVAVPLGRTVPHFPLYAAEAVLVELVALLIGTRKSWRFGALAGIAVGTAGLAAEWGWSHVWAVLPWPSTLWPEAAILGLVTAIGGGIVGAWFGTSLNRTAGEPQETVGTATRWLPLAGFAAVITCLAISLPITTGTPGRADVTLRDVAAAPNRTVQATITLTPADAADQATWFTATSWQGGGLVVDRLRKTGPGTWTTTKPLPVHDSWKTTLRLQRGSDVIAVPIYLPEDNAIPAREIPATASFSRDFMLDKKLLQREQKRGVPSYLWTIAYAVVGLLAVIALLCIGAGTSWAARNAKAPEQPAVEETRPKVGV